MTFDNWAIFALKKIGEGLGVTPHYSLFIPLTETNIRLIKDFQQEAAYSDYTQIIRDVPFENALGCSYPFEMLRVGDYGVVDGYLILTTENPLEDRDLLEKYIFEPVNTKLGAVRGEVFGPIMNTPTICLQYVYPRNFDDFLEHVNILTEDDNFEDIEIL